MDRTDEDKSFHKQQKILTVEPQRYKPRSSRYQLSADGTIVVKHHVTLGTEANSCSVHFNVTFQSARRSRK